MDSKDWMIYHVYEVVVIAVVLIAIKFRPLD